MRWALVGLSVTACGHSATMPDAIGPGLPDYALYALVKAPMPQAGEGFGVPVAISGDGTILAISERGATVGTMLPVGAVHVFLHTDTDWEEEAVLQPDVGHPGDLFGVSLGMSTFGDMLVVGAIHESSNATGVDGDANDTEAVGAGAAYVFRRVEASWSQVAYLKAANAEAGDAFGSVAISGDGNTVAVGAVGESSNATGVNGDETNNLATNSGAVYVFTTDGTTWRQAAYLKASKTDAGDGFGNAVSLSADGAALAIGAPGEDSAANADPSDKSQPQTGAVFVFQRGQTGWAQTAHLKATNAHAMAGFGTSVSLSGLGTTLAIGAPSEQSDGSAPSDTSLMSAGAAYVFALDGSAWSQRAYLKAPHPASMDELGGSVSLSLDGEVVAVGDAGDDSVATDSGATEVFAETGGTWQPLATVTAPTPSMGDYIGVPGDHFGLALGLSHDGAVLAATAPSASVGATDAGMVFVFY